jgi:hypothetical protein
MAIVIVWIVVVVGKVPANQVVYITVITILAIFPAGAIV